MMATAPAGLTERQQAVLDAIGSRDAVSPEYVSRTVGEYVEASGPVVVSGLIVAGLVERCYSATMLRLTYAGRQALPGVVPARAGWTVDGFAYRRAGRVGGQTYGAHVQLEAALAPEPDRPWRAYAVVEVDDRGPEWPPVQRSSWHASPAPALQALDTFIDGLVAL